MGATHFSGPVTSTSGFTGNVTGNQSGGSVAATTITASSTATITGLLTATAGVKPGTSAVALTQVYKGTVAVDPAEIAANTRAETQVTITGAATGDIVIMNPPAALEAGLVFSHARVSAANTVQVGLGNITGSPIDGASLTWSYAILRFA